jgi:hypothetical protein
VLGCTEQLVGYAETSFDLVEGRLQFSCETQFSEIFENFRRKKLALVLKCNVKKKIFVTASLILNIKTNFFAESSFFKIVTLTPASSEHN